MTLDRKKMEEMLLSRLYGELTPEDADAFDAAIHQYPDLQAEYQSNLQLRQQLKISEMPDASEKISTERLEEMIATAVHRHQKSFEAEDPKTPWYIWFIEAFKAPQLAAVVLVCAVAGVGLYQIDSGALLIPSDTPQDDKGIPATEPELISEKTTERLAALSEPAATESSQKMFAEAETPFAADDKASSGQVDSIEKPTGKQPEVASLKRSFKEGEKGQAAVPLGAVQRTEPEPLIGSGAPSVELGSSVQATKRSASRSIFGKLKGKPEAIESNKVEKKRERISGSQGSSLASGATSQPPTLESAPEPTALVRTPAESAGRSMGDVVISAPKQHKSKGESFAPVGKKRKGSYSSGEMGQANDKRKKALSLIAKGLFTEGVPILEELIMDRKPWSGLALTSGIKQLLSQGELRLAGGLMALAERTANPHPSWTNAMKTSRSLLP